MSADYWSACPNCVRMARERYAEATKKLDEAYGNVSRYEYEKMERETQLLNGWDEEDYRTLAEYHDLGILDGKVYVKFQAVCRQCGWECEYSAEKRVFDENSS